MSSTRNKNTPENYSLEQRQIGAVAAYPTYANSAYGDPTTIQFAGNGLLMGRMPPTQLSNNSCDIETQLFGIGSTNLVTPKSNVVLEPREVKSLNVADRLTTYIPDALVVDAGQRPQYYR